MVFLATLIALLIERFFHWSQLRQWRWFDLYQTWINARFGQFNPGLLLAVYVLPIAFVLGIICYLLSGWFFGLLHVAYGALVLLYCLGPSNLWAETYQCLDELSKNGPEQGLASVQKAFGITSAGNSQAFHQAFLKALFVACNQRIFAVIFWFTLLGPMGAFIYRAVVICESTKTPVAKTALKVHQILDWVPVRLVSFLFALTGNFTRVFVQWRSLVKRGLEANDTVLVECGLAALDSTLENQLPENGGAEREMLQLFDRVLIMTLAILAIVAIMI